MLKRLLVHLDASPRSAVRLRLAHHLARRHGANLTALYGVLPSILASPWASGEGLVGAAALMAELDQSQRERARSTFDQTVGTPAAAWIEGADVPLWALLQQAWFSDLLVLGQPDPADPLTGALPPELVTAAIIDSGKPTLLVPHGGAAFEAVAQHVLIAWKPCREAARAVAAAWPWLREASQVHVVEQVEPNPAGRPSLDGLEVWLRAHGVVAPVHRHTLGASVGDVGAALVAKGSQLGADLLVMGCYGHSRTREWVLGGASRSVLELMSTPVLMVH